MWMSAFLLCRVYWSLSKQIQLRGNWASLIPLIVGIFSEAEAYRWKARGGMNFHIIVSDCWVRPGGIVGDLWQAQEFLSQPAVSVKHIIQNLPRSLIYCHLMLLEGSLPITYNFLYGLLAFGFRSYSLMLRCFYQEEEPFKIVIHLLIWL